MKKTASYTVPLREFMEGTAQTVAQEITQHVRADLPNFAGVAPVDLAVTHDIDTGDRTFSFSYDVPDQQ